MSGPLGSWRDGATRNAIVDFARTDGWTVISMKDGWACVFTDVTA